MMVTITVRVDKSCNMAYVDDGMENGLEGNFWDFHNGCYGDWDLPEFNNMEGYIQVLKNLHEGNGDEVKIIRKSYKY